MKNFLVCQKCDSSGIKITGIKHKDDRVGVRLGCDKCGEEEIFSVAASDFLTWVVTPEIADAMKVFNKKINRKDYQVSLW